MNDCILIADLLELTFPGDPNNKVTAKRLWYYAKYSWEAIISGKGLEGPLGDIFNKITEEKGRKEIMGVLNNVALHESEKSKLPIDRRVQLEIDEKHKYAMEEIEERDKCRRAEMEERLKKAELESNERIKQYAENSKKEIQQFKLEIENSTAREAALNSFIRSIKSLKLNRGSISQNKGLIDQVVGNCVYRTGIPADLLGEFARRIIIHDDFEAFVRVNYSIFLPGSTPPIEAQTEIDVYATELKTDTKSLEIEARCIAKNEQESTQGEEHLCEEEKDNPKTALTLRVFFFFTIYNYDITLEKLCRDFGTITAAILIGLGVFLFSTPKDQGILSYYIAGTLATIAGATGIAGSLGWIHTRRFVCFVGSWALIIAFLICYKCNDRRECWEEAIVPSFRGIFCACITCCECKGAGKWCTKCCRESREDEQTTRRTLSERIERNIVPSVVKVEDQFRPNSQSDFVEPT
eukprot:TRINITY_DN1392_c0_g1_i1.p1 TRINITY_DN1392_c0_g1~~TRINITY_DN1392_c0_g1_i1.p1  ORF type:complete len:522 (-),score=21.29 TRINITY_DN1392_c0_g1_i1:784-2181(-)